MKKAGFDERQQKPLIYPRTAAEPVGPLVNPANIHRSVRLYEEPILKDVVSDQGARKYRQKTVGGRTTRVAPSKLKCVFWEDQKIAPFASGLFANPSEPFLR